MGVLADVGGNLPVVRVSALANTLRSRAAATGAFGSSFVFRAPLCLHEVVEPALTLAHVRPPPRAACNLPKPLRPSGPSLRRRARLRAPPSETPRAFCSRSRTAAAPLHRVSVVPSPRRGWAWAGLS